VTSDNDPDHVDLVERHICTQLKALRTARELSHSRVDAMAGLPVGTCKSLEQGKAFFGTTQLYALAKAFEVEPARFFKGLHRDDSPPRNKPLMSRETADLIMAFQDIEDVALRRTVIGLVDAVVEDPSYGDNIAPFTRPSRTRLTIA